MTPSRDKIQACWTRLEDAKLQFDHAHNYAREVASDIIAGKIALAGGEDAFARAVRVQKLAIRKCNRVLKQFNALLSGRNAGQPACDAPLLQKGAAKGSVDP